MPEVVQVLVYLSLLSVSIVNSLSSILLPVIKFAIYDIYWQLGSHAEDYELWYDITKSGLAALSFIYTLFFTIGNI